MASGKHPAMIYADQAIDGPIIGTLVVIVDRGRNLPNRRSYGKQDPFCVARLGKEHKRTEADKRGGQTPVWDKELRFTVRDSPDYKTLKITCFNEDKKTELIGECSLTIDKILVKGGGTEDGWRPLNCKGKYAGDLYIELSFWDTRPREEPKPRPRPREIQEPVREKTQKGLSGPRSGPAPKERIPYRERLSRDERDRVAKDRATRERSERMENERMYTEKEQMRAERDRGKSRRRRERSNTMPAPERYSDSQDEDDRGGYVDQRDQERAARRSKRRDDRGSGGGGGGGRERANTSYVDRDYVQTVGDSRPDRGRADRQRYRQTMPPQGYDHGGTPPSDYAYDQQLQQRPRRDRYYDDQRDEYYQDDGYGRRPDSHYDDRYQQPPPLSRNDPQFPEDRRIMPRPRSFVEDDRRPLQIQQQMAPLQPRQTQRRPAPQQIDNGPPPPPPPHRRLPALPPPDAMQDQIVARTEGSGLTRLKSLRHHKSATEFRHNDVDPSHGYANPHDEMGGMEGGRNGSYSSRHNPNHYNDGSTSPIPPIGPNAVALRNQHLQRHDSYVQYDDRNPLAIVRANSKFDAPKQFPPAIPPTPGIRKAATFDHELGFEEKTAMVPLNLQKRTGGAYGGVGDPNNTANRTMTVATRTLHHVRSDSELSRKATQRDPRRPAGKTPIPYGRGSYVNPDDRSTPQIRDGIALPPSLVPGIDPTVADELTERMNHERRLSFNDAVPSRGPPPAPYVEDDWEEESRGGRVSKMGGQGYSVNANRAVTPLPNRASQPIMEPVILSNLSSSPEKFAMTPFGNRGAPTPAPGSARPGPGVVRQDTPKLQGDPFSPDSFNVLNPNLAGQMNAASKIKPIDGMKSIYRSKNNQSVKPGAVGPAPKKEERDPRDVLPPSSFAPEPEKKDAEKKKEEDRKYGYAESYRGKGRTPSPQPPMPRNGRSPSPMPPRNTGRTPSPQPPRPMNHRTPSPQPPMHNGRSPSPMPPRNVGRTPSPQPPRRGEILALPAPGMEQDHYGNDHFGNDMSMVPRYDERYDNRGRQGTVRQPQYQRESQPYASKGSSSYSPTKPIDINYSRNSYGNNPNARHSSVALDNYNRPMYSNPSARHSTAALPSDPYSKSPRNYDDYPSSSGPLAIAPPPADITSLTAADLQREIEELQRAQQRLKAGLSKSSEALPYDSSREPPRRIAYDDRDRDYRRDGRGDGRGSYASSPTKGPLMLPAPDDGYYDDPGPGALVLSTQSENYRDQQYHQQNLSRGNSGGAITQHRNSSYNNIADSRREPSYPSGGRQVYGGGSHGGSRVDLGQGGGMGPPSGVGADFDLTRELAAVSEEMKRIEMSTGRGTARRRY